MEDHGGDFHSEYHSSQETNTAQWEFLKRQANLAPTKAEKTIAIAEDQQWVHDTAVRRNSEIALQTFWKPGFVSQFPWLGVGAILSIILCMVATVLILLTSNNKAQEEWPVYQQWTWINNTWKRRTQLTPSTALAAVNTISNIAIAIAFNSALAVAWWRKTMIGATVRDLHKSWAFSNNILEIFTAGRSFNFIAVTCLVVKLAIFDNVLLQLSTHSETGTFSRTMNDLRLPVVAELPAGYAGSFDSDGSGYLSGRFSEDLFHYSTSNDRIVFDTDLSAADTRCEGICTGTVQGFGLEITCEDPTSSSFTVGKDDSGPNAVLDVNATSSLASNSVPFSSINLNVRFSSLVPGNGDSNCEATVVSRTCNMRPAVVNYPIQITNIGEKSLVANGIKLAGKPTYLDIIDNITSTTSLLDNGQINGVTIKQPAYLTDISTYDSNIHAIRNMVNSLFSAYVSISYNDNVGFTTSATNDAIASWWVGATNPKRETNTCTLKVPDPTIWIISQLNSIMLRASISAATTSASTEITPIEGIQTIDSIIYRSNYVFMIISLVILLLSVITIIPLYHGFWELGRKVSLAPMEVAAAFQAPILDHPFGNNGGGEIDTLLNQVGKRVLRYGQMEHSGKIGMAQPSFVRRMTEAGGPGGGGGGGGAPGIRKQSIWGGPEVQQKGRANSVWGPGGKGRSGSIWGPGGKGRSGSIWGPGTKEMKHKSRNAISGVGPMSRV